MKMKKPKFKEVPPKTSDFCGKVQLNTYELFDNNNLLSIQTILDKIPKTVDHENIFINFHQYYDDVDFEIFYMKDFDEKEFLAAQEAYNLKYEEYKNQMQKYEKYRKEYKAQSELLKNKYK